MERPEPSIAAVIPVFNRAGVIGHAIASVRAQSYPPAEIVVVDDGSTDGTPGVVRGLGADIRLVCERHGGASHARNAGVRVCTSEWIAFLDSDDTWAPDYLARMAAAIRETAGELPLYFADAVVGRGDPPAFHWAAVGFAVEGTHQVFPRGQEVVLRTAQPMLLPFTVIRRAKYLECGGLREDLSIAEDTHLFIRIGLSGPLCAVRTVGGTVHHREGVERLSLQYRNDREARWEQVITMCRDLLDSMRPAGAEARVLRRWMAEAHWRLARLFWAGGNARKAVREAGSACTLSPGLPFRLLRRTLVPRTGMHRQERGEVRR